jgi:cell division septation protein DedD
MPQAQTQTTPPVAPKPAALVVTAKLTPGYYVNVGAFAVEGNANKAYQRLQEAGMTAVAQTLTQRKRTLMRVGAGPFPTRAAAQAAAKKIALIPLDTLISKH